MNRWMSLVAVLVAAPALAAHSSVSSGGYSSHSWSVESGETVGTNNSVIYGQAGFPGIWATYLHGVQSNLDLGGRFSFNYGVESSTEAINPELKFQFVSRINFIKKSNFNLGLEFSPGVALAFANGSTDFGMTIPVELAAGIPVNSQLTVDLGFGMPVFIRFTHGAEADFPILFGGGVEYYLQSDLALTFRLRMGPIISTTGGGSAFGLQSLIGVAYKL